MAGLVPATTFCFLLKQDVDARHKAGMTIERPAQPAEKTS